MFWNNGLTRRNESRLILLVLVMLSAMLLPSFEVHPSLPNIRVDEVLLFGIFGLNFLAFIARGFRFSPDVREELRAQQPVLKWVLILWGLLTLSYAISNFYGVVILGAGYYGLRDVMELVTFFKHFLVITLVLSIDLQEGEFGFLKNVFLGALGFLILFGWGQHFNLFNMNTWISPFFNPLHWDTLILGNPARVLGTFDNPNVFGIFTVITLSYLTVRYFFGEHQGRFPWLIFVLIGLVIKLEFLTISRTALFGIALLYIILCAWAFFYHHRSKEVLIKIGALFLLTIILFATASGDFFYRLTEGLNFSNSTSFQGHMDRWGVAVGSISQSPILGWGTQKYVMTTLVDNEYALFSRRYGFVGLVVYLSFFLLPFIKGFMHLRRQSQMLVHGRSYDLPSQLIAAYVAVLPSIFVYNFMAGIFYNLQLMTLFSITIGLAYNSLKRRRGLL
ncbi:O-antigen ligase family protein [Desulfitobacterium hafniense]|uniref:O-antigen ligase family protein n=1 Tax=Desulfitobacterium hafniense TaxID=49338 RepID=UPI00036E044A|nr:O-antigen ligase family protein [Desulfitobacterium hafniense]